MKATLIDLKIMLLRSLISLQTLHFISQMTESDKVLIFVGKKIK